MLLESCVIHQNIEAAKFFHGLFHGGPAELWVLNVARNKHAMAAFSLDGLCRFLCVSLLYRKKDHGDVGALARVNQGHFIQKLVCAAVEWRFVFRPWRHIRFNPRMRLMLPGKRRLRLFLLTLYLSFKSHHLPFGFW